MRALTRVHGTAATSSSGTAFAVTAGGALYPFDLAVLSVGIKSATCEVSGIAGQAGVGGTWVRAHRQVGGASSLELWVGYGFTANDLTAPTVTVTTTVSAYRAFYLHSFRHGGLMGLPTLAQFTGTFGASGTTSSIPTVTPTATDESQLTFGVYWQNGSTTAPTFTYSPPLGTDSAAGLNFGTIATGYAASFRRVPTSLTPQGITSSAAAAEWVSASGLIVPTPRAVLTDPIHVYKGRQRRSLDTVGAV